MDTNHVITQPIYTESTNFYILIKDNNNYEISFNLDFSENENNALTINHYRVIVHNILAFF